MWRYLVIAGVLLALTPLIPHYLDQNQVGQQDQQTLKTKSLAQKKPLRRRHEIPVSANGQYITKARLNGRTIEMLVDTGASTIALPLKTARLIGIRPRKKDYIVKVETANGVVYGAPATIRDLRVGSIRLEKLQALILPDAALSTPLLGMSALQKLHHFGISDNRLLLIQ